MKLTENKIIFILFMVTLSVFLIYLFLYINKPVRGREITERERYVAKFPEYMYNNSTYAPIKNKGFGVPVQELDQPAHFYRKHRKATLKYLSGVYPNGMDSISSLGDLELASFFNSLTYYYNCDFNHQKDDLQTSIGNLTFPGKWDKLPCASEYPLPYPPQGWFFDWSAFNTVNVPYTYSDSSGGKDKLGELGSCRPGVAFITAGPKLRSGPGPLYVNCRAAIRNAYRPRGIVNTAAIPPMKDGERKWDLWKRMNVVDNRNIPWKYPWGWQLGTPDNQYIEVCHTIPTPGMVQSMGWWFNAMTGTGIFLNVGRSMRTTSKLSAMLDMLFELKEKDVEKMKQHFGGLTDPYMICWYQIAYCGYERNTGKFSDNTFCQWKYVACQQWCIPDSLGAGGDIDAQKPNKFWDDTIDYQKMMGISKSDQPTPEGIKAAIDAAIDQSNYTLSRMSVSPLCDEPTFFLGSLLDYDTIQYTLDPNGNGYYTIEIMDCRVPTTGRFSNIKNEIKNRDYSTFVGTSYWSTDGKLEPLRDVTSETPGAANKNDYYPDFISEWMKFIQDQKIITIRDPLDIKNEKKVDSCIGIELESGVCPDNKTHNGQWYNLTCDKVPLAAAYRCLQLGQDANDSPCVATGNNPSC